MHTNALAGPPFGRRRGAFAQDEAGQPPNGGHGPGRNALPEDAMRAATTRRDLLGTAGGLAGAAFAGPAFAQATCDLPQPARAVEISTISNAFPVLQFLMEQMRACSRGNIKVETRLTADNLPQTRTALQAGGNVPFQIVHVSNTSFVEFVNRNYLQPIGDLVTKHRDAYRFDDIPNGLWQQVMHERQPYVLPFQSNTHVLFYRRDLLEKHGIAVPTTIEQMIAAAAALKAREPAIEHPLAGVYGRGWSVATEFANIYQSLGGEWFDARGTPTFNDARGQQAVELMKAMLPFMSPNALAFSTDDVMVAFQQGRSAMGIYWASRAANMDAADVSRVPGAFAFAKAPSAAAGGLPSAAIWWDGFCMPRQINVDRELVFRVMAEGISAATMRRGANLAFFSRTSVVTDPALVAQNRYWPAITATIEAGTKTFPPRPYFSLAHTAVGANIIDALQGRATPKDVLDRAATQFTREARSQGFL
jgi:ABC-type glycerol-3-phosphate transport system substrate-binding protein